MKKALAVIILRTGCKTLAKLPFGLRKNLIFLLLSLESIRRKRRIKENIRLLRPDLESEQIKEGIRRLHKTRAENYATLLGSKAFKVTKEAKRLEVSGEIDRLLNLYRSGEKLIVVSSHTGPYDIMLFLFAYYLSEKLAPLKLKVFILVEDIPIIDTVTTDLRKVAGDNIHIGKVKKGETLNMAAEYLNKGYIVVFAFDMIRKNNRGVVCRIGSAEARFPAGFAVLALRKEATVVSILPSSGKDGKIKVKVGSPFIIKKTEDIKDSVRGLVSLYEPFFLEHYYDWLQLQNSYLKAAP